jgi:hypothetical protein
VGTGALEALSQKKEPGENTGALKWVFHYRGQGWEQVHWGVSHKRDWVGTGALKNTPRGEQRDIGVCHIGVGTGALKSVTKYGPGVGTGSLEWWHINRSQSGHRGTAGVSPSIGAKEVHRGTGEVSHNRGDGGGGGEWAKGHWEVHPH